MAVTFDTLASFVGNMLPEAIILLFAVVGLVMNVPKRDGAARVDWSGIRNFYLVAVAGAFLLTLLGLTGTEWHFSWLEGTWLDRFSLIDFDYRGANFYGSYVIDTASQLLKVLFLGSALLALIGMGKPLKGRSAEDFSEFCALILFALFGMMMVASARELITLLLGIETASFASYLLAGFRRDAVGAEASLKYFTVGAVASGLTVFGISLLYGMAGSTRFAAISEAVVAHGDFDAAVLVPIGLILAGLGFKISSMPFHAWAPDVYQGAPPAVAGMLAAASKAMGFSAIAMVFMVALPGAQTNWQLLVAVVAAATMTFGNLVALQQTNVRRMLAYSSIAQAGYLLIAVVVGTSGQEGGVFALGGGLFHLLVNAAMKLGAFLVVGALLAVGVGDQFSDWRGLGRRAPIMAIAMAIFLLSMAGLPPLGGFASKFVLFGAGVDVAMTQGLGWVMWLVAFAIANSAVSLYVYLRVLRSMVVDDGPSERLKLERGAKVAVAACALLVLAMGIWPQPFVEVSMQAATSLLGIALP